MDSRKLLIALSIHYQGDWKKIYHALIKKDVLPVDTIEMYLSYIKCKVLTILDADYPAYLRETIYPPFVLFYYGDISLISDLNKNIAVVGGRHPTPIGKNNAYYIVNGIAKQFNIVSGLAIGIDTIAHKAALDAGGRTIGILANGIEYCYPAENSDLYETLKKHHLVISEYFDHVPPEQIHFHQRNRLIVALSRGTIIGESTLRSGTSITAKLAHDTNKELMSIPSGDIYNSLSNSLIRDGCAAILSPDDVIGYINFVNKTLLRKVK